MTKKTPWFADKLKGDELYIVTMNSSGSKFRGWVWREGWFFFKGNYRFISEEPSAYLAWEEIQAYDCGD
jgi:hypothetical protein